MVTVECNFPWKNNTLKKYKENVGKLMKITDYKVSILGEELAGRFFGMTLDKTIKANLDKNFSSKENKNLSDAIYKNYEKTSKISCKNLLVCALILLTPNTFDRENQQHVEILQKFLNYIKQDSTEINKDLHSLGPYVGDLGFLNLLFGFNSIYDMTHRFSYLPHLDRLADMCSEIDSKKNNKTSLINLADFGRIRHLAQLESLFTEFREKLPLFSDEFKAIHLKLRKIHQTYKEIGVKFEQQVSEGKFQLGKLAFDSVKKKSELQGHKLGFIDTLNKSLFTYGHTALLDYDKGSSEIERLHIDPRYKNDKLDIMKFLQADYFDINILNLINDISKPKLEKLLGDNWKSAVKSIFQTIEIKIYHDSQVWDSVKAHQDLNTQVKHVLSTGIFDRVSLAAEAKKMSNPDYKPPARMLCSEFVARRIVLAIHKFNDKISDMSDGSINSAARYPFGANIDFASVSPASLLKQLDESNCLQKTDVSQYLVEMGLRAS